jgi:hypothetical protein
LEKLDHSARIPHVLTQALTIIHAGDTEEIEAPRSAKLSARILEQPLEVCTVAVPLRGNRHSSTSLYDCLGDELVGPLIVRRGVDDVYAELEAALERIDRLLLGNHPQLTGTEPND